MQQTDWQETTEEPSVYPYEIEASPDYTLLKVQIPADQTLKVEKCAMAAMDTNIEMKTKIAGGISRLFTRESFFINDFKAKAVAGEISVAPGVPGDICHYRIDKTPIFLTGSSYLASGPEVEIDTKFQGLMKGFFSGESLFLMHCSGTGDLWFNSYGAIFELDIEHEYIVDTGHIVAFTEGLDYKVEMLSGYKSFFFSGEGFVCRFRGKGKVWIRVFPHKPVTKKPAETRQGKGKGSVEYWVAKVKPGRIMFEIDGVSADIAREAFRLAAAKLPVKTRFVTRVGEGD